MQLRAANLDADLDVGELEPLGVAGSDGLADLHSEVVADGAAVSADDSLAQVDTPLARLLDDLHATAVADRPAHVLFIGDRKAPLACVASARELRRRSLPPRRTSCRARTTSRSAACSAC